MGRIHASFSLTGSDQGVHFIDKENDASIGLLNIIKEGFESLLKLTAKLRTCDHCAQVETDNRFVLQGCRYISRDYPLGEALDDGSFSNSRLTDKDRIVLGSSTQDVDDSADFFVAADDRVEFSGSRFGGEVNSVFFEGLIGVFCTRVGDPFPATNVVNCRK